MVRWWELLEENFIENWRYRIPVAFVRRNGKKITESRRFLNQVRCDPELKSRTTPSVCGNQSDFMDNSHGRVVFDSAVTQGASRILEGIWKREENRYSSTVDESLLSRLWRPVKFFITQDRASSEDGLIRLLWRSTNNIDQDIFRHAIKWDISKRWEITSVWYQETACTLSVVSIALLVAVREFRGHRQRWFSSSKSDQSSRCFGRATFELEVSAKSSLSFISSSSHEMSQRQVGIFFIIGKHVWLLFLTIAATWQEKGRNKARRFWLQSRFSLTRNVLDYDRNKDRLIRFRI